MAKDNSNAAEIAELETLPMGELRKRAAKLYGVKVTTDMLKVDIIRAIRNVLNKSDVAKLSKASEDGSLEPGWASITLHYVHGESRHPLMASVNGYMCKIPKDVRVDVPIKVMKSLKDCKKTVLFEDLEEAEGSKVEVPEEEESSSSSSPSSCLMESFTPPLPIRKNALIVDPFAGSGSTGKAAILEGFQFVGFELDPQYTAIANARLEAARHAT